MWVIAGRRRMVVRVGSRRRVVRAVTAGCVVWVGSRRLCGLGLSLQAVWVIAVRRRIVVRVGSRRLCGLGLSPHAVWVRTVTAGCAG